MMYEGESRKASTIVAIVSSNYLLRLGLQRIVENEPWIHLVGHVPNYGTLDDMLGREQPHVMIVDTEISKDISGLIKRIKSVAPRTRIILLSGLEDPESTRQAIDFAVDGIVLKVQPSAVLVSTIRYLTRSSPNTVEPAIPQVSERVAMNEVSRSPIPILQSSNPNQTKWPDGLTEREREIIKLISLGLSNKDIADRLCISSITVRHHLTSIFDKLGVSNRQKLLIRAHQYGIEELSALA
jgi:DNA-binding NarL/FixJ family response regulator